jgi:6-pyruvoyl tetrahydropterin synthase/QueD family protein
MSYLYAVTKEFSFEAAHILDAGCNEACSSTIHGHSYRYTVTLKTRSLNAQKMVLDFKVLSEIAGFAAKNWDHGILISEIRYRAMNGLGTLPQIGFEKLCITASNPTAEWMASYITSIVRDDVNYGSSSCVGIEVCEITTTVWETAKCCASCTWKKED